MELFTAIVLLCQVASIDKGGFSSPYNYTERKQLECQQSYAHCFNMNSIKQGSTDREVLTKCIQERKL